MLENLDVSKIYDLSFIFRYSNYNGDISKWDVSNCLDFYCTFRNSIFNNDSLKNWNIENVGNMNQMFAYSEFNGDVSNWDISNCRFLSFMFLRSKFDGDISSWQFNENADCYEMFRDNIKFENKYNNKKRLSNKTNEFLEWFKENTNEIRNKN